MRRWTLFLTLLAGCANVPSLSTDEPTEQVASHPFGGETPRPAPRTRASYAPAAQEIAFRVDRVGQELVGANKQAGLRPIFATIGAPTPEIFHVGSTTLYITEGLVRQCATDRELAAVLASELGKMVADREAVASRKLRDPDVDPPPPLPIGGHGYDGDADPSRVFEMSKYESRHPRQRRVLPRPDPAVVARSLLEKAGRQASDLDAVQPLLQAADSNVSLEKQLKGAAAAQGGWSP